MAFHDAGRKIRKGEKQMAKPNKAVVVFSGGQDSTTCLFWAKKKYDEVIALSFNYGQRHSKELECAKKICKEHGVEHHILDMGLLNQLAPNSYQSRYGSRS